MENILKIKCVTGMEINKNNDVEKYYDNLITKIKSNWNNEKKCDILYKKYDFKTNQNARSYSNHFLNHIFVPFFIYFSMF